MKRGKHEMETSLTDLHDILVREQSMNLQRNVHEELGKAGVWCQSNQEKRTFYKEIVEA